MKDSEADAQISIEGARHARVDGPFPSKGGPDRRLSR